MSLFRHFHLPISETLVTTLPYPQTVWSSFAGKTNYRVR